jgi:secondary thiamine-phosphate synthase enzyme
MKKGKIAIDGASLGNPGPAGIGIVIFDESDNVVKEVSEPIGLATNNAAEYNALIRALSEALAMEFSNIEIQTDSELMARQISGEYKIKSQSIRPLHETALSLLKKFESAKVVHVSRDKNKLADTLASNAALKSKEEISFTDQPAKEIKADSLQPTSTESSTEVKRSMIQRLPVRTSSRVQFVDITADVQRIVRESGISEGICTVYVPHTTAGITINENADPDVTRDIIDTLERLVPRSGSYRHAEGNADSHVKASLMGFSVQVLVQDSRLLLGTWQGIYFCEFDGPRNRQVYVRVG